MKKYRLNIAALFISTMIVLPSCDFGDTNVDPQSLSSVTLDLVLPSAITQVGFNNGAVASRNPGIVMQYFEGTDAQQLQYTAYNMPDNTFNNLWRTGLYGGAMKDLDLIIDQASSQNAPYYAGIGKVLMANSLGTATNFFGDVPYSNAFQGDDGVTSPVYDTQEVVYDSILSLLTSAIADFETNGGDIVPSSDDLLFGGDADAWKATAYALQARYLLQLAAKGEATYAQVLAALGNAFSSNGDNANLAFDATATGANPLWGFHTDRSNTMVVADYFKGVMAGDPRLTFILEPGTTSGFAPNTFWGGQSSPTVIINYAECKFIEAEALVATGAAPATVLAAIKAGIGANMDEMGVAAADKAAYLEGVTATSLQGVITEKYKSLYPQNVAWDDYRRTGFPAITPNADNAEGLNPGGNIPQRFIYPNSEKQLNAANVQVAIDRQGADLLSTTLWIFE